jgi:Fe-S-cluster containining protein
MTFTYPADTRFECTKCGICCGNTQNKTRHILLLAQEIKEITKETALDAANFCFEIEGASSYVFEMRKQQDGKCVFLKNNQCIIYDQRPLICRFYPFELKFSENDGYYLFNVTFECPGVGLGKRLEDADFRRLFLLAEERLK